MSGKKKIKKPRNPDALTAIVGCKGGKHKAKKPKKPTTKNILDEELLPIGNN